MAKLIQSKETIAVLQKTNFRFKKQFGQNFLIDSSVLKNILDYSEINKEDLVLEIGPGIGTLTEALCEKAGFVIAIEIDDNLIPILKDNLSEMKNFSLLHGDALKVDFQKLLSEHPEFSSVKVVANLPYYITTPILMSLLEKKLPFRSITVMVQKEVALRMKASPGTKDYGALSLAVQYHSIPELVQRRKTLVNALSSGFHLDKKRLQDMLGSLSYPENVRGETLSLEDFALISDAIGEMQK